MKRLTICALTCLSCGLLASAAPGPLRPRPGARAHAPGEALLADPFQDQRFAGESGEKGRPANEQDTLVFSAGRFRSTACDAWGFGDAPYRVTKSGGEVSFDATTTSPREGRMVWHGKLVGDLLEGQAVWTKPGQAPIEYWFKATKK